MSAPLDAIGTALPAELTCSECGDGIERGYVPVTTVDAHHEPDTDLAVCDTCGWRDIGHMGCVPELRDFDSGNLLVRIEPSDGGVKAIDVIDEA